MSAGDLRSIQRRYHLLLALRWAPSGLAITVFVLLPLSRGLTLAEIGIATAAQGLVMLALELPSGGLADALGRKPVLQLAGLVSIAGTALVLAAHSVAGLAVAAGVLGISRALDSGPLQSWFVDASLAADPDADLEQGLGWADVVICAAIGGGALVGGFLVRLDGVFGVEPLVVPLLASILLQVVGLLAVTLVLDEPRRASGWRAAARTTAGVPTVVREAVRLIRRSRLLTALVIGELLWGFGMVSFETFMPPRLAELTGDLDGAAANLGPVLTVAWAVSAAGAALAPRLVRRWGAPRAGFVLRLVHGGTVAAMAAATSSGMLVVGYVAAYWAHGATGPVHYGMVHRAVEADHRATVVSANSLTSQVGAAVSGIALGALADATSLSVAMAVAAVVLAAAAPLYLVGRDREVAPVAEPVLVEV